MIENNGLRAGLEALLKMHGYSEAGVTVFVTLTSAGNSYKVVLRNVPTTVTPVIKGSQCVKGKDVSLMFR